MKGWPGSLVVGISGGAIGGALLRYAVQRVANIAATHPYGTLLVNILGSFILGFVAGFFSNRSYSVWYYAVATGFCGSFTTFSSISMEVFEMLRMGLYWRAFGYVGVSLISGLIAIAVGWWLGLQIAR